MRRETHMSRTEQNYAPTPAGRYFRSTDELKRAITVILGREMNHRLKGYLVA